MSVNCCAASHPAPAIMAACPRSSLVAALILIATAAVAADAMRGLDPLLDFLQTDAVVAEPTEIIKELPQTSLVEIEYPTEIIKELPQTSLLAMYAPDPAPQDDAPTAGSGSGSGSGTTNMPTTEPTNARTAEPTAEPTDVPTSGCAANKYGPGICRRHRRNIAYVCRNDQRFKDHCARTCCGITA